MENIRVKITRDGSNDIAVLTLEEYLRGVVPAEMPVGWQPEAYKAQAIAARTYALHHIRKCKAEFDVDDTTAFQAYKPGKINDVTDKAVKDTEGLVLYYAGTLVDTCVYSSSNGGRTSLPPVKWSCKRDYLISKFDPYNTLSGKPKNGHGVGMSQWGAEYAARRGLSYEKILAFYYPGTYIVKEYTMEPDIKIHLLTENDSYKNQRPMTPDGIMVHSTASPGVMAMRQNGNASPFIVRWNAPGMDKSVHFFVDDEDIVQTLPLNIEAMHSGKGSKGSAYSANRSFIGFEICEPTGMKYKDSSTLADDYDAAEFQEYFNKIWQNAIDLCVYLCQKFSINPDRIICHSEGCALGIAGNHADVMHWFPKHGVNMDIFREEVKKKLGITTDIFNYYKVNTSKDPLNVRETPGGGTIGRFEKGETVKVDQSRDGWAHASALDRPLAGWVVAKYLLQIKNADPEPEPEPLPEEDTAPLVEAIETVCSSLNSAIEALKNVARILKG